MMPRPTCMVLPLLLAACATNGSGLPQACGLVLVAQVPFLPIPGDRRVELAADVDHHPAHLLLDTGADITALTDVAFQRLGSLERAEHSLVLAGVGGSQNALSTELWRLGLGRLPPLQDAAVPGIVSNEMPVVVLDHSILPPIPPTDGLLGLDALAGYDIDFDFTGGALGLYRAEGDCGAPHSMLAGRSWKVELHRVDGTEIKPRFDVRVDGLPMVAEIDTGAPTTVLLASAAHRLGLGSAAQGRLVGGVGDGQVQARNVRLDSIRLGTITLRDMPATVLAQDLAEPVDMLLGADFAQLVHMWFSRSSNTLILQYPPAATPRQTAAP